MCHSPFLILLMALLRLGEAAACQADIVPRYLTVFLPRCIDIYPINIYYMK